MLKEFYVLRSSSVLWITPYNDRKREILIRSVRTLCPSSSRDAHAILRFITVCFKTFSSRPFNQLARRLVRSKLLALAIIRRVSRVHFRLTMSKVVWYRVTARRQVRVMAEVEIDCVPVIFVLRAVILL